MRSRILSQTRLHRDLRQSRPQNLRRDHPLFVIPNRIHRQCVSLDQRKFMQECSRAAAIKRMEAQRGVPQAGNGEAVSPVPARRGHTGGQSKYAPAQAVRKPVNLVGPNTRPARDGGRKIGKTVRSGRKTAECTAKQTIKTAEHSSRQAVNTAQQTAKATAAAIKAAIAATQESIAAIVAGGRVILVVVLLICIVGLLIASPFGIFFADGGSPDAVSPTSVIAQINGEYADRLFALQTKGTYDRVEIQGRPPSWADVFAVFAAKIAGAADGASVAVLGPDTVEKLRVIFWDMTKITTTEADVEPPAEGNTPAWTEKVLTITVMPRTPDDMRVFYLFTDQQNAALDELLTEEIRAMWNKLLYGSSGEIVAVALSQVGNVGGHPYWSWYGFNSRVEWCACFVS